MKVELYALLQVIPNIIIGGTIKYTSQKEKITLLYYIYIHALIIVNLLRLTHRFSTEILLCTCLLLVSKLYYPVPCAFQISYL